MAEFYNDSTSYDNENGNGQDGGAFNKRPFDQQNEAGHQSGGYGGKRPRRQQDGIEMRCLVPARCAGAIIGKGGSNIKELREAFQASVFLPDGQANERVLKVAASPENCGQVLLKVLPKLEEGRRRWNEGDEEQQEDTSQYNSNTLIKLLVHQSQAGGIIGTRGVRIKELREKTGAFIKVHQECAGQSTDRICQVSGSHSVIADCVKLIMELLETIPPKGPVYNYDPNDDLGFGIYESDTWGYEQAFGGGYGQMGGYGYGMGIGDFGGRGGGFRGRGGRGRGGRGRGGRGRGGRGGPRGGGQGGNFMKQDQE